MNIKGKIVIVTGASSGIGEATARLLINNGAKVALVARSKNKLEKIAKELPGSIAIIADMSKPSEIRSMIKKAHKHFGRIDILVNNAGVGYDAEVLQIDLTKYHYLFDLVLAGPLIAIQEVVLIMKKAGGGAIVNISSGTALINIPGIAAYSSLKRALAGLSLTAREELKNDKIQVSVVYPYITNTNFFRAKLSGQNDNQADFYAQGDPAERVAQKILEAIETGAAEIFLRDEMKK